MRFITHAYRAPPAKPWLSVRTEEGVLPFDPGGWRPEHLWLSPHYHTGAAQQMMANAVSEAVDARIKSPVEEMPHRELLTVLRHCRKECAWLRLAARVLRGSSATATSPVRDLAASALFVAATWHDDLLASIEFCAEVTGHAVMLEAGLVPGALSLPPGMATSAQWVNRMRRRGREVLGRRLNWPDLDTIGPCLDRALSEDPLRGLGELNPARAA